jgi:hypothetical protein
VLTDLAGAPQSAKVGTAFTTPLQVQVSESVGTSSCPAANVSVEFTVYNTGAGASFDGGSNVVSVEADSSGTATAPTLYADDVTGSFTVVASFDDYVSAPFELTNTTVGVVNTVTVTSGSGQFAPIGGAFAEPLVVTLNDAYGDPVAGTTVDFDVVSTAGAGASFAGAGTSASVQTGENGVATSPTLTAGTTAGAFTVTANVAGVNSVATFDLTVQAGVAANLTAGVGDVAEHRARHGLRRTVGRHGHRHRWQRPGRGDSDLCRPAHRGQWGLCRRRGHGGRADQCGRGRHRPRFLRQ